MTQTWDFSPRDQQKTAAISPTLPTGGDELYDFLMGQIEPDLITRELPLLKEKYKNESTEEARARAARYANAFNTYKTLYADYTVQMATALKKYRLNTFSSLENEYRSVEKNKLAELEQYFMP